MPTDNFWLMPGNGILSGLVLNPADASDTYGSAGVDQSTDAPAAGQPWVGQGLAGIPLGYAYFNSALQPPYASAPLGVPRPIVPPAPSSEAANAPWLRLSNGLLPIAPLPDLGFASDFISLQSTDGGYASSGTSGLNTSSNTARAGQPLFPPSAIPISYQDAKRPWWNPPYGPDGVWDRWRDQFIKGMQGLDRFYRSRGGFGGGRNDDDQDCYQRWEAEEERCYKRDPQWWADCKERAAARRDLCLRNGGQRSRYEPREWSKDDEETWFNPDR